MKDIRGGDFNERKIKKEKIQQKGKKITKKQEMEIDVKEEPEGT